MTVRAEAERLAGDVMPGRRLVVVLDLLDALQLERRLQIGILVEERVVRERERDGDPLDALHEVRATGHSGARGASPHVLVDEILHPDAKEENDERDEYDQPNDGYGSKPRHAGPPDVVLRVERW